MDISPSFESSTYNLKNHKINNNPSFDSPTTYDMKNHKIIEYDYEYFEPDPETTSTTTMTSTTTTTSEEIRRGN